MIEKNEAMGAVVVEKMGRGGDTLWKGDLAAALLRDFDASGSLANNMEIRPLPTRGIGQDCSGPSPRNLPPTNSIFEFRKNCLAPGHPSSVGDVFFTVGLVLSREVAAQR